MASEELRGVLRRVDWFNGTMVLLSGGMRSTELKFDLTPSTPDFRNYIGREVTCVLEDGMVIDMILGK